MGRLCSSPGEVRAKVCVWLLSLTLRFQTFHLVAFLLSLNKGSRGGKHLQSKWWWGERVAFQADRLFSGKLHVSPEAPSTLLLCVQKWKVLVLTAGGSLPSSREPRGKAWSILFVRVAAAPLAVGAAVCSCVLWKKDLVIVFFRQTSGNLDAFLNSLIFIWSWSFTFFSWITVLASQKCWGFSGILVALKSCDLINYVQKSLYCRWNITQERFTR